MSNERTRLILAEKEGAGWPHAAIAAEPGYWIVYAYTDCAGRPFLSPRARVRADHRRRHASFDDAWRVALSQYEPATSDCARC